MRNQKWSELFKEFLAENNMAQKFEDEYDPSYVFNQIEDKEEEYFAIKEPSTYLVHAFDWKKSATADSEDWDALDTAWDRALREEGYYEDKEWVGVRDNFGRLYEVLVDKRRI